MPYLYWQETGRARTRRKNARRSTKSQKKSASKSSIDGPLPEDPIDSTPDTEAVEAPPSQVPVNENIPTGIQYSIDAC